MSHRFVEAQPAPVQQDLIHVCATQPPIYAANAFIPHDDADAVEGTSVVVWLVAFRLELALQLHPIRVTAVVSAQTRLCPVNVPRLVRRNSIRLGEERCIPDLDGFEGMRGRDGTAGGDTASYEGTGSPSQLVGQGCCITTRNRLRNNGATYPTVVDIAPPRVFRHRPIVSRKHVGYMSDMGWSPEATRTERRETSSCLGGQKRFSPGEVPRMGDSGLGSWVLGLRSRVWTWRR